ncbi:MAG: antibiotic biosynthesis monooxygenase [Chitinophagaceae bacterium]
MYVRLTYFNIPPEKADDLKTVYYDDVAPVIRQQMGIIDVMLLVPGHSDDEYISCTIWKNDEYIKDFEKSDAYPDVFEKIKAMAVGAPKQKYYQIPQH